MASLNLNIFFQINFLAEKILWEKRSTLIWLKPKKRLSRPVKHGRLQPAEVSNLFRQTARKKRISFLKDGRSRGPAFPSRMRSCVWMRTTSAIYFPNTCRKHSVSQYLTIAIQSVAFQNLGIRLTRIRITEPEYFFIKKQRRGFACWTKKRSRSMKPKGM